MVGFSSMMVVSLIATGSFDGPIDESEKQAIAELTKLGAKIVFQSPTADRVANDQKSEQLSYVLLDKNWTGGDEGLKQIERLPRLTTLYITGRPQVSEAQLAELKKTLPDLAIRSRSSAVLGIVPSPVPPVAGCLIGKVMTRSPATKAGLMENDVIKQFDGELITSFDDLVKEMSRKEPDDEVNLTVLRNDKEIIIKVKLGRWQ